MSVIGTWSVGITSTDIETARANGPLTERRFQPRPMTPTEILIESGVWASGAHKADATAQQIVARAAHDAVWASNKYRQETRRLIMGRGSRDEAVDVKNIRAIRWAGSALVVAEFDPKAPNAPVNTRDEVMIPKSQIDGTSKVQKPGDRGTLVIPQWLAVDREFIDGDDL